jgi:hypothetical protein
MEEEQIDAIPFRADSERPLTRYKCEIVAEFQKEPFELGDDCVFRDPIPSTRLSGRGIRAQTDRGSHSRPRAGPWKSMTSSSDPGGHTLDSRPAGKVRGPTSRHVGLVFVVVSSFRIGYGQQANVMGPRERESRVAGKNPDGVWTIDTGPESSDSVWTFSR